MSKPKFKVGDVVAVCTLELNIVIPKTTVLSFKWVTEPTIIRNDQIVPSGPRWSYRVADSYLLFHERCLRPYRDDDYSETEQETKERAI